MRPIGGQELCVGVLGCNDHTFEMSTYYVDGEGRPERLDVQPIMFPSPLHIFLPKWHCMSLWVLLGTIQTS